MTTSLDSLNPHQKEAATYTKGPLLVIAGAGSGKTKTLVHRVAHLIESGTRPENILLLTFTRKSAQEMLKRASLLLDNRCRNVSGGTFHGFANIILRDYTTQIGYPPQFTILDRGDAEDLINLIRRNHGLNKKEKRFPKKNTLLTIISKATNTTHTIGQVLSKDFPNFLEFEDEIEALSQDYQTSKKQMGVMDYDDLLTNLAQLLATNPTAKAELQAKFQHILVDEYQDTNAIQAQIIQHLAESHHNIMVVGDDSQSIYSFRGANFKNIMNFPNLFPNTHIITLEENYRSTQPILDLTNALINNAREKYPKSLYTQKQEGPTPHYIEAQNENEQSTFICKTILELRENGLDLNKIAVLIRSGWHSNDLEVELQTHGIPFVKYGGFKFIETAHVKDLLAYIKVISNPLDQISWSRLLLLQDGIGPKAAQTIISLIPSYLQHPATQFSKYSHKPFYKPLLKLLTLIHNHHHSPLTPIKSLEKATTLYQPVFEEKYDDYTKRSQDLDSLTTIAERFETVEDFLTEISLDPPDSSQQDSLKESQEDEKITISTIHSSKGLEWNTVFILSAVDGYIPSFQSLGDINQIEEERRLMYVALTRAKKNLYILKPHLEMKSQHYYRYPGITFSKLSRFLQQQDIITTYATRTSIHPQTQPDPTDDTYSQPPAHPQDTYNDDTHLDTPPPNPKRRKYYF